MTLANQLRRLSDRVFTGDRLILVIDQALCRTTVRAGIWLGMKTSVRRFIVLLLAGFAHDKRLHTRGCSIIWDVFYDTQARSAMRAVGESILKTTVRRLTDILEAGAAGRCIGDYTRGGITTLAGFNRKAVELMLCLSGQSFDTVYSCQGRTLLLQSMDKGVYQWRF